jgi:hypothetical protein
MDAMARQADSPKPADTWLVHRHTLDPKKGLVLDGSVSELSLTRADAGGFTAQFALARGRDPIALRRNLIGVESYHGRGQVHHARVIHVEVPGQDLQALVGHVTAYVPPEFGVRDLFIATREKRTIRPVISAHEFPAPLRIPLFDHLPHGRARAIRLSKDRLVLEDEQPGYAIGLDELPTGGYQFRTRLNNDLSIGGLVLPLDQETGRLLLLCFRHNHSEQVHGTVPRAAYRPVGDIPGHPACTTVYFAYEPS